jgi:hypothetical protein
VEQDDVFYFSCEKHGVTKIVNIPHPIIPEMKPRYLRKKYCVCKIATGTNVRIIWFLFTQQDRRHFWLIFCV